MAESRIFPIKGVVYQRIEGRTYPRFACQYCDEIITHAPAANIVWDNETENEALIVHKECDVKAQAEGRRLPFSMELDTELVTFLRNAGMTGDVLKRAQEKAEGLYNI